MATIDLGKIKLVWRGTYAGGTAYTVDDVVQHTDSGLTSSFICTTASTGNAPSTGGSVHGSWAYLAKGGTAGTDVGTTITTQGDILYRDGSGLQRLAKGTAGQALKMNTAANAPEWGTISSDYVKIKTQTVVLGDGVAYVDFIHGTSDVVFDNTYNTYKFIVSRYAPASNSDLFLQVIINGTVATTGYITRNYRSYYSGGEGSGNATDSIAFGQLGMIGSNTINQSVLLSEHTTTNPSISQYPQVMSQYSGAENTQIITSHCAGKYQTTTTQWNGMRFKTASGNFEGTVTLYGIK